MWITLDSNITLKPNILIDCRDLFDNKEIMPTYKLAKELHINKGLIFSIDSLFFAIFFLKNMSDFKNSLALIKTLNREYYLSNTKMKNSFKIKDIIVSSIINNKDSFVWNSINIKDIQKGRGLVKFDSGYIIFEDE